MGESKSLPTWQIGKLGELLVQYTLLKHGIESAQLTTDAGVDLVAYSSRGGRAFTIQVKTNLRPKPGGGRGKPALDWWVEDNSPADYFAFTDVSTNGVWLFAKQELKRVAQQHSNGRFHLYMYTDPQVKQRGQKKPAHIYEFERYRLENRISEVF